MNTYIIILLLFFLFLFVNKSHEDFLYTRNWNPNYILESHYPPYSRFISTPQEKFYATWCSDCFLQLKERDAKIKKLEDDIKKLNKKI
jgi:hypothetical protein